MRSITLEVRLMHISRWVSDDVDISKHDEQVTDVGGCAPVSGGKAYWKSIVSSCDSIANGSISGDEGLVVSGHVIPKSSRLFWSTNPTREPIYHRWQALQALWHTTLATTPRPLPVDCVQGNELQASPC